MKIIGHRGARGLAPENTIAALEKGMEHHVDELEFDVRTTKDGVAVLSHNKNTTDQAGNQLQIAESTLGQLISHKPDLTTLSQALDYVNAKCHLYVEVKPGVPVAPIVKVIRDSIKSGTYSQADISLGSFSQKTLRELHKELPEVQMIVIEKWSGVRAHIRAKRIGTRYICMNQRWLWRGFISAVHRSNYKLYAYTLNDPAKAKRWARYGLAGIVTDFPDRFEK